MQGGIERIKPLHPFVRLLMNAVYIHLIRQDVVDKLRAGVEPTNREWKVFGLGA